MLLPLVGLLLGLDWACPPTTLVGSGLSNHILRRNLSLELKGRDFFKSVGGLGGLHSNYPLQKSNCGSVWLLPVANKALLQDGLVALRRGIKSCRDRQAYLKLVAGKYVPDGRGCKDAFLGPPQYLFIMP